MRNFYLLCFAILPFMVFSQSANKTYVSLGISQAHAHLYTAEYYNIYGNTGGLKATTGNLQHSRSLGVSLGASRVIHPRWEVAVRVNYTGATVQDTIQSLNFSDYNLEMSQLRDRTYRTFWTEALVFWRLVGDRSLLDIQLGTGLAYLKMHQRYDSGFSYDRDIDVMTKFKTFENIDKIGIPVHLQVQYPLNYHVKIGGAIQVNNYFDSRHKQSTIAAFVAYRW